MRKTLCLMLIACAGGADLNGAAGSRSRSPIASPSEIPSTGKVPDGCERIEGAQIGRAGVQVLGGTVTFTTWRAKDGEPGEYVGFELNAGVGAGYAVKTGGETHYGSGTSWVHPEGTSGPKAPAISNVTVCPMDPGGAGGGGGSNGGGSNGGGSNGGGAGGGGSAGGGGLDEGSPCTTSAQCLSQKCSEGICVPNID